MNVRSNPDYAPITLRRIELMQGRLEAIYMSLYLSALIIFGILESVSTAMLTK